MEVLLDRCVVCVDELQEIILETGGVPLDRSIAAVVEALPPCSSRARKGYQEQSAIEKEITRYREEVEEPAFAILRERKACRRRRRRGARKEPVTFKCADADYYREVLDGIDARLPPLAPAPAVNSLTLSISWPPEHHLWNYPVTAYIASHHANLLAIHFGPSAAAGCYLVFNSWDDTLALIPPLPTGCVTSTSHCSIGAGVAVLSQDKEKAYLLAELFLHQDARTHLASLNKAATLLVWCSLTNRWIHKEVVLPLPADHQGTCSFRANMVLQISSTSLCWVDLRMGILTCRHMSSASLAAGDDLEFKFIPLLQECEPLSHRWWGDPEECRSMCCMDEETIKFVSMDIQEEEGRPMVGEVVTLTSWALKLTKGWRWEKDARASLCIGDQLLDDDRKPQPFRPGFPVISRLKPCVTYLSFTAFKYKQEQWEAIGFYELSVDMPRQRLACAFKLPSRSAMVMIYFASPRFVGSLNKRTQRNEDEVIQQHKSDGETSTDSGIEADDDVMHPIVSSEPS